MTNLGVFNMSLKHFIVSASVALACAGFSCGAIAAQETAAKVPTYTVGTGATYRPFEFQTPNKEIVGFDIDLMKEIAKAQGFKVEFINTLFGVIFESVKKIAVIKK